MALFVLRAVQGLDVLTGTRPLSASEGKEAAAAAAASVAAAPSAAAAAAALPPLQPTSPRQHLIALP